MTAFLITLGVTVGTAALMLFLLLPSLRRHEDRKLLTGLYIAHRGLHDIADSTPENSLAAFRFAAENGIAIEIDIHITCDGEIVVFHDDTLSRMCGVEGRVEHKTLAELKTLRLKGSCEQIPTLREVLGTVAGRVPLLIEFKTTGHCKPLCEKANEILSGYSGKYIIQSFFPPVLRWYKKHRPDICRGQLSTVHGKDKPWYYKLASCQFTNFLARPDFLSFDIEHKGFFFFRAVVALGAHPVGWTFKSQAQVNALKDTAYTYIFENFLPEVMPDAYK